MRSKNAFFANFRPHLRLARAKLQGATWRFKAVPAGGNRSGPGRSSVVFGNRGSAHRRAAPWVSPDPLTPRPLSPKGERGVKRRIHTLSPLAESDLWSDLIGPSVRPRDSDGPIRSDRQSETPEIGEGVPIRSGRVRRLPSHRIMRFQEDGMKPNCSRRDFLAGGLALPGTGLRSQPNELHAASSMDILVAAIRGN
jgi:hypothetical protein